MELEVLADRGTYFSPYFKETSPGQFNFTSDRFTIGNGPFEEIILEREEDSDTIRQFLVGVTVSWFSTMAMPRITSKSTV